MSRDPRKLEVFQLADALVVRVYRATREVPTEERYGLQMRLGMLAADDGRSLCDAYEDLLKKLQKLLHAIERM